MKYPNLDLVSRIDFDQLDSLVSERVAALKLYAQNLDKIAAGKEAHEAICRDLILPNVSLLMQFLESVSINDESEVV